MSEINAAVELAKVHRRLDQLEHLLTQHKHRQKQLDAALEEARQFRAEILKLGSTIKVPKELTKRLDAVDTAVARVEQADTLVKGLETRVLFLEEKIG